MRILALDLGTRCGWALQSITREFGLQIFDVKRGESPGMRYIRFNAWLDEIFNLSHPDIIVYEQTHNRGGAATEVSAGFATRVQEFCARHNLNHSTVHSGTLKKFATGSGHADKSKMIEMAQSKFGYSGSDDNEADALWILEWSKVNLNGGQNE